MRLRPDSAVASSSVAGVSLPPDRSAIRPQPSATPSLGDWPRTTRLAPWLLAAFLAMVWLIPFDAVDLAVQLPFDAKLDRFALLGLLATWILVGTATKQLRLRQIWHPITAAFLAVVGVAIASICLNLEVLVLLGESSLAVKKLLLLLSFLAFFVVVATTVRTTEIRNFVNLMLVLAGVAALGTLAEYRVDVNHFYGLTADLIPGAEVAPEPAEGFGRRSVTGPTAHGLAITTMFGMAVPFALVGMFSSRVRGSRVVNGAVVALLLAGSVATVRKTGIVAPGVALLVLTLYRPRQMIRLLPFGLVVIVAIQLAAPNALTGIQSALQSDSEGSTSNRVSDYDAVRPDLIAHPALGRGFGTYDPRAYLTEGSEQRHRLLDNQLLVLLIEVGVIGVVTYLALAATAAVSLHRFALFRRTLGASLAIAALAAIATFVVTNALYDTLAFPHVPYLFAFILGLTAVLTRSDRAEQSPLDV